MLKGDPPSGKSPYLFNVYPDYEPREYINVDGYLTPADFDEFHEENNFITADDIARLADEKAGPNATHSFYDLMGGTYWVESKNKNIEQDAPLLSKRSRANMEGQLEPGAIKAANNYAAALANATGKDWDGLTESEFNNPLTIPKWKRDVLSFAYMYGPEGTPTSKYLKGDVPFGEFWSEYWNRTGDSDRAAEVQKRFDKTYPGTQAIFPERMSR